VSAMPSWTMFIEPSRVAAMRVFLAYAWAASTATNLILIPVSCCQSWAGGVAPFGNGVE